MSYFSEKLRELRLFSGMLQKDVAVDLSMPLTTYNNYELGKTEPTYNLLIKIADYHNISIDELIGREIKTIIDKERDNDITELIKNYKRLSEKQKRHIRINIYTMLEEESKIEKEINNKG